MALYFYHIEIFNKDNILDQKITGSASMDYPLTTKAHVDAFIRGLEKQHKKNEEDKFILVNLSKL